MTMALPERVSIVSAVLRPWRPTSGRVRVAGYARYPWHRVRPRRRIRQPPARPRAWAAPVVLIAEYGFFIGLFGQTPGMWMVRIRCVSMADGGRLGLVRAALRGALLCLVVPALIMKDGRGLHDRAVGSVVLSLGGG